MDADVYTTCGSHRMSTLKRCTFRKSRRSPVQFSSSSTRKSNHFKFNKLLNFKFVLKKLTEYNLFPHKIKSISNDETPLESSDHNLTCNYKSTDRSNQDQDKLGEKDRSTIKAPVESLIESPIELHTTTTTSIKSCSPKLTDNEFNNQSSDPSFQKAPSTSSLSNSFDKSSTTDSSTIHSSDCSSANCSSPHHHNHRNSFYHLIRPYHIKSSSSNHSSNKLIFLSAILFILLLSLLTDFVYCDHINLPPRFVTLPGYSSDIVLAIKEGNSSLNKEIYRLAGEDPNGDKLKFGVMGPIGSDILRIENDSPMPNQATIYLRKELDRETQPSYSLVLTLTDGRLAKGSFVSCVFF